MPRLLKIKLEDGSLFEIDQNEWAALDGANRESIVNGVSTTWNVVASQHPDGRLIVYVTERVEGKDVKALGMLAAPDKVIEAVYRVAGSRPSFQESIDGMAAALRRRGFQ